MLDFEGKYGEIHVEGRSINIEKTNINDLEKYLKILEEKKINLTDIQNEYLSKIIG